MLAHVEQSGFILVRVGSKWGHGASWLRHHGSSWSIFGVHGVSWRALGGTMGTFKSYDFKVRKIRDLGVRGVTPYMSGEPLGLGFGSSSWP